MQPRGERAYKLRSLRESPPPPRATQNPASCDLLLQSAASMPPPPPPLMDDLVEEVLLRLPPDSPASLVRAGLVCKRWCHLVSDPVFHRRFIDFHGRRAPPMLGFMTYSRGATRFVPTSASSSGLSPQPHANLCGLKVCDSRHGRVLLRNTGTDYEFSIRIVVWNPITGEQLKLPEPALWNPLEWTAAVVCTAAAATGGACDHLDCHRRPFLVVLVGTRYNNIFVCIYDSEAGAWREPTIGSSHAGGSIDRSVRSALVGNTLYFVLHGLGDYPERNYRNSDESGGDDDYQHSWKYTCPNILEYNLGTRRMSVVQLPGSSFCFWEPFRPIEFTTMDNGRLGFVRVEQISRLCVWSREAEEPEGWVLSKTIQLAHFCPSRDDRVLSKKTNNRLARLRPSRDGRREWASGLYLVGSAEGVGIIFLASKDELFTFDLRSNRLTKVYAQCSSCLTVPYMYLTVPCINACTPGYK